MYTHGNRPISYFFTDGAGAGGMIRSASSFKSRKWSLALLLHRQTYYVPILLLLAHLSDIGIVDGFGCALDSSANAASARVPAPACSLTIQSIVIVGVHVDA